jgi:hypothetical protein
VTPAIFTNPNTTSHPTVVPYVSVDDYTNAPTSVDTSQLIPGGTAQANLVELGNVIRRASSWADNLCFQILAATLDTQSTPGAVLVKGDGLISLVCDFWPVLEVDSLSVGTRPTRLGALMDDADMWPVGRSVIEARVGGVGGAWPGSRVYAQWTYWNGWLHATLLSSVGAAVQSLPLSTTLPAAAANQTLIIWDGADTEAVTVSATFTGGTLLPLTAPTLYAHANVTLPHSTCVSGLEDAARQAVFSLTSCLIKTRGTAAIVAESIGAAPSREALIESGGLEDFQVAVDLLDRYKRVA